MNRQHYLRGALHLLHLLCLFAGTAAGRDLSSTVESGIDVPVSFTDTNWGGGGLVLQGYDVVEYHNLQPGMPGLKGSPDFAYNVTRSGDVYEFWFKDQANLDTFKGSPKTWIPMFGGFCAYGTATADQQGVFGTNVFGPPAEPELVWTVYEGSLYFNPVIELQQVFVNDPEYYIELAKKNWILYFGSLDAGPINTRCFTQNWQVCTTPDLVAQPVYGRVADLQELVIPKGGAAAGSLSGGSG